MQEVKLVIDENGKGSFKLLDGSKEIGEMVIGILGTSMRVYHTEVNPAYEGQGLARKLLDTMVSYARENHLKVTPLCEFVHAQFKRHPDDFADIWNRG
jgi:uncharacterized protein